MFVHSIVILTCFQAVFSVVPTDLPLDDIVLPPGFTIEVYADKDNHNLTQPREIHVEHVNGAILTYVGTADPNDRSLRVLVDKDGDHNVDESHRGIRSSNNVSSFFAKTLPLLRTCPAQTQRAMVGSGISCCGPQFL